ncbi:MAG TPA: efflux RND transporter periplasmic adaptor subunit [Edaphocola sp.]|nr:efflux RND transporter periplasmic adaptor subunit [Edaphocola sp.]
MNKKLLLLFSILLISISCKDKKETITPETKNITESVYASGIIKSKRQYEVFGKTNAVIQKIFVTEGMPIKKGDPIFQLDNKNLKIATENARLASNASDYKVNADKLMDAKKAITLAEKQLENDYLQFQRHKNLWDNNIGTKIDLEEKELKYENTKINLAKTKSNYEDLKRQLKLASDESKNNLKIAKIMEDDYIIRSEVDGVIYKINKEEGEIMNAQEPSAVIGTDEFIIELNIDEFDIVKIKKDQLVIIRMDSYQSEIFEAKITTIDPMMNIRTRSFKAEAVFTKKPKELFPNLTVEANIVIQTKKDILTIPRKYMINDSTVMLKGGKLQKIGTGLMDYDLVEITSGIDKTSTIEIKVK